MKCCESCKWANISSEDRTVVLENVTVHQKGGGIICECPNVRNITFDYFAEDTVAVCSSYECKDE